MWHPALSARTRLDARLPSKLTAPNAYLLCEGDLEQDGDPLSSVYCAGTQVAFGLVSEVWQFVRCCKQDERANFFHLKTNRCMAQTLQSVVWHAFGLRKGTVAPSNKARCSHRALVVALFQGVSDNAPINASPERDLSAIWRKFRSLTSNTSIHNQVVEMRRCARLGRSCC